MHGLIQAGNMLSVHLFIIFVPDAFLCSYFLFSFFPQYIFFLDWNFHLDVIFLWTKGWR